MKDRRRQERGKQRSEQLLAAAERVFASAGYAGATTNHIADEAGVSPGTLYQFFPNKQAIAEALAARYADRLAAAHERARMGGLERLSLTALVDRMVDPFLEFHREAPAFGALFVESQVSPELAGRVAELSQGFAGRLSAVFREWSGRRIDFLPTAEVCVHLFKGLLPLAVEGSAAEQRRGVKELKAVMVRYTEPILGPGKTKRTPNPKPRPTPQHDAA